MERLPENCRHGKTVTMFIVAMLAQKVNTLVSKTMKNSEW
ncbi:hypothetical protein BIFDEN_00271 [Bifidobacterium dentium ATCC 27678]|uniref:Uncharacterized protein n=1 Tax=Bifidobacterium dentium (strain ATCC 27534 / DSM 20436 / JCM 1195 / Bd1) TaxID=401473 RepID=D2Q8P3_BIFDB|nr:hypothetical protein BDP_0506 [Bifidobacterium dentium Bd1]EDT44473.1 hypothetical protein BIFDEN_00271 [Bifidobacterium dentium ATCC 27678]